MDIQTFDRTRTAGADGILSGLRAGPPAGTRLARAAALAPGTPVMTRDGAVPVETLGPGDCVLTRDNGLQPLIWAGAPVAARLVHLGATAVTPGTRVLVSGPRLALLVGRTEGLARAADLGRHAGRGRAVALLFDGLEVIRAGDLWCESLLPDPSCLAEFGTDRARDLRRRFPRLAQLAGRAAYIAARPVLDRREAALLR